MKTIKLIFAFSLTLLLAAAYSDLSALNSKTNDPEENKARVVTYVVRIAHANYVKEFGKNFIIVVTDETGTQVAPPKTFRHGMSDYVFTENGTVRGTRTAGF